MSQSISFALLRVLSPSHKAVRQTNASMYCIASISASSASHVPIPAIMPMMYVVFFISGGFIDYPFQYLISSRPVNCNRPLSRRMRPVISPLLTAA